MPSFLYCVISGKLLKQGRHMAGDWLNVLTQCDVIVSTFERRLVIPLEMVNNNFENGKQYFEKG